MNKIRDFVANLSLDECQSIHAEQSFCEEYGHYPEENGECVLRKKARELRENINPHGPAFLYMDQLVKEVWRRFAVEKLETESA